MVKVDSGALHAVLQGSGHVGYIDEFVSNGGNSVAGFAYFFGFNQYVSDACSVIFLIKKFHIVAEISSQQVQGG